MGPYEAETEQELQAARRLIKELTERLHRVMAWHQQRDGLLTCAGCEQPWPCYTYQLAQGTASMPWTAPIDEPGHDSHEWH